MTAIQAHKGSVTQTLRQACFSAGGLSRPHEPRTGSPGGPVERGCTVMTRLSRRDTPLPNPGSI